jgi:hypothetical protein
MVETRLSGGPANRLSGKGREPLPDTGPGGALFLSREFPFLRGHDSAGRTAAPPGGRILRGWYQYMQGWGEEDFILSLEGFRVPGGLRVNGFIL